MELRGIKAAYGGIEVVHGVDLVIPPATVLALLGPNGAGKSTLLKAILGIARVMDGRVALDGADVTGLPLQRLARLGVEGALKKAGAEAGDTVLIGDETDAVVFDWDPELLAGGGHVPGPRGPDACLDGFDEPRARHERLVVLEIEEHGDAPATPRQEDRTARTVRLGDHVTGRVTVALP